MIAISRLRRVVAAVLRRAARSRSQPAASARRRISREQLLPLLARARRRSRSRCARTRGGGRRSGCCRPAARSGLISRSMNASSSSSVAWMSAGISKSMPPSVPVPIRADEAYGHSHVRERAGGGRPPLVRAAIEPCELVPGEALVRCDVRDEEVVVLGQGVRHRRHRRIDSCSSRSIASSSRRAQPITVRRSDITKSSIDGWGGGLVALPGDGRFGMPEIRFDTANEKYKSHGRRRHDRLEPDGRDYMAGLDRRLLVHQPARALSRAQAAGVEEGGDGLAVGLTLGGLHHRADECAHRLALAGAELRPRIGLRRRSPRRPSTSSSDVSIASKPLAAAIAAASPPPLVDDLGEHLLGLRGGERAVDLQPGQRGEIGRPAPPGARPGRRTPP